MAWKSGWGTQPKKTSTKISTGKTKWQSGWDNPKVDVPPIEKARKEIENTTLTLKNHKVAIPKEEKKDPGVLSRVFDVLSRGNYASANSMIARRKELKAQREEAVSKAKTPIDKAFARMTVPKYSSEPTKAFFRGLKGKEKHTYDDVLAKEGIKKGLPRTLLGLAGDITLDPTNLINPAGAVGKVGKGIAKVAPGTTAKIAKAGEAVRSTAPVQLLGKGFIPNFRPAGVAKGDWNTYVDLKKGYEVGLDSAQHKLVDDVIGMAKGTNKKQRVNVTDALETGLLNKKKYIVPKGIKLQPKPILTPPPKPMSLKGTFLKEIKEGKLPHETTSAMQNLDVITKAKTGEPINVTGFRQQRGTPVQGTGEFFAATPNYAAEYGGKVNGKYTNIGPKHSLKVEPINLQNPLVIEGGQSEITRTLSKLLSKDDPLRSQINKAVQNLYKNAEDGGETSFVILDKLIKKAAEKLGHDGIVYRKKTWFANTKEPLNETEILRIKPQPIQIPPKLNAKPKLPLITNKPIKPTTGDPKLDAMAQQFRGKFDEIQQALEQRGLLKNKRENYVTHINRDKETKLLGRLTKPLRPYNPYNRQRTIEGTVKEINERTGKQFFEDDIARILGESGLTSTRAIHTKDFVDNVASKLGRKVKATGKLADGEALYMPKGNLRFFAQTTTNPQKLLDLLENANGKELVEIPADLLKEGVGVTKNVEAYAMPQAIAEELNNYTKFDNGTVDKVLRKYDKYFMNPWKALATAANPGFHVRNAVSNQWQNFLNVGGKVFNPIKQTKAAVLPLLSNVKVGGKTYSGKELVDLMKENGVLNQGWLAKDVPEYIEKELQHGLKKLPGKAVDFVNPFSQNFAGRKVGNAVENQARTFSFLQNLEKTGDAKKAAELTDKFLFDYGDLTDFEKKVMRRGIPFYTWMRKNVPLQVEQLAKQPGKYAAIPKVTRAIESQSEPVDETWLPDYMKGQVRTPLKTENGPIYWNPNMPYQDLEKLNPKDIGKTLIPSLAPPLKASIELGKNKNFFFDDKIENTRTNFKTGGTEVVNVKSPAYLLKLPDEQKRSLGMVLEKNASGKKEWKMPPRTRYLFQQIPFLENVSKGMEKKGTDKTLQLLSWLGGIKGSVYDVEKEKENADWKKRDQLRDILGKALKEGIVPDDYDKKKTRNGWKEGW